MIKKNKKRKKHKNKLFFRNISLVAIIIALTLTVGGIAGIRETLRTDLFAQGVYIDGMDVSGMSYDSVLAQVTKAAAERLNGISLTVEYSGEDTLMNAADIGIYTDAKEIVDEAFRFNKLQDDSLQSRFDKSLEISDSKIYETSLMVDESVLENTVKKFANEHLTQAEDAKTVFNKDTISFSYIEGKDGYEVDVIQLMNCIRDRVEANDFSSIAIEKSPFSPEITEKYLKENTVLIGAYESLAANNENRNTNIKLMCGYVDGLAIQPGETLSINGLVGQRTEEKGFAKAPAIMDGTKLIDDLGGGICQVSGTLYNAALLADMEIVERVRHSWPSNYLPIGQDSTLNWDDKDLKIKNRSDMPMYISAKFEDQVVRIEIYGKPLEDNMTVNVQNKIIEEIKPPPSDVVYTNQLPVGAQQYQVTPRTGYHVKVYRYYMKDGRIVNTELISEDNYPVVKGIILKGSIAQEK